MEMLEPLVLLAALLLLVLIIALTQVVLDGNLFLS